MFLCRILNLYLLAINKITGIDSIIISCLNCNIFKTFLLCDASIDRVSGYFACLESRTLIDTILCFLDDSLSVG